jgi:hypothetical protein
MASPTPPANQLTPRQERRWFGFWVVALVLFFLASSAHLLRLQWRERREQREHHRQTMDAAAPDPGVTAAATSSTAQATPVEVGFYIERIPELSIKDATWTVVFNVWFRWRGDEIKPAEGFVVMEGAIESKDKLAEYHADGVHYERYSVVARITKPFPVANFPRDEHLLTLAIENGELVREKMVFVPDTASSAVSSRVSVPGYRILDWKLIEKPHSYRTTGGDPRLAVGTKSTHSQVRLGLSIVRGSWGLYVKMFQALYVAVVSAFLACFIKPTDLDPRFGLGVGALFAAVANSYLVSSFVPDTGDLALADLVNGLGIATILVTLIESTISLHLYDRLVEPGLSRRLDRVSFVTMLGGFLVANLALVASSW